jgi:hypothetical protein
MSKKEIVKTEKGNIVTAGDAARMFGDGSVQLPVDAPLPQITIMRESAQFEMPDGAYKKDFTGHLIYWHNANTFFSSAYGEGEAAAPDCCSSNGIKPDGGQFPQAESCRSCDLNKFQSASDGQGKACKNTIRLYVLADGEVIPSLLIAPPTSLAPKDSLIRWLVAAPNTAAKAGMGTAYQPIQVKFTLRKKEFNSGMTASVVQLETVRVLTLEADEAKLKQLQTLYQDFMANYMGRLKDDVAAEGAQSPSE